MSINDIFAAELAKAAGLAEAHCVGLVRLSIKDAGKSPDDQLTYTDYTEVIQTRLGKRLQAIDVRNVDAVIAKLVSVLNEKQSLLTMTVR
jgi:hypothetical protein